VEIGPGLWITPSGRLWRKSESESVTLDSHRGEAGAESSLGHA